MKYDLNGYWVNVHKNPKHEEIFELVHIKQNDHKIKLEIEQYKNNSVTKFYGKGIIKNNSVMAYYYGLKHSGVFAFNICYDSYNHYFLDGEYIEDSDVNFRIVTRDVNHYTLKRTKLNIFEHIKLCLSKNKYKEVKKMFLNI